MHLIYTHRTRIIILSLILKISLQRIILCHLPFHAVGAVCRRKPYNGHCISRPSWIAFQTLCISSNTYAIYLHFIDSCHIRELRRPWRLRTEVADVFSPRKVHCPPKCHSPSATKKVMNPTYTVTLHGQTHEASNNGIHHDQYPGTNSREHGGSDHANYWESE